MYGRGIRLFRAAFWGWGLARFVIRIRGRAVLWLNACNGFLSGPRCGLAAVLAVLWLAPAALAQSPSQTAVPLDSGFGPLSTARPQSVTPQQIVQRFAAKETEFKQALDDYTYRRTVKLDTLDEDGAIDGEYLQVDDILFSPTGQKEETVVYAPNNTLRRVTMSPADFDDIEHRLPFTLTTQDVGEYRVNYVGMQTVDRVNAYVFEVAPRRIEKGHRYFQGRIWVDAQDYQIIVTDGRNVPDDVKRGHEDLSLPFITYRQQIDGKYWFPVYTKSEGVLHFQGCNECLPNDVHLREIVKYADYKRFGTKVRIFYQGQDISSASPQPNPVPASPAAAARGTVAPGNGAPPQGH